MSSASDNENFLKAYHAKHPGCTPQAMANGRTADGGSSYDLLSSVIPASGAEITVLDLACGDGFFLEQLLRRSQTGLRLIGVDMSDGELSVAKRRLGDGVELHQANAKAIPLPNASVDYVTCHMALMLMDSIEDVIAEIRRVLKPRGKFSAVVGAKVSGYERPPSDSVFIRVLDDALESEGLKFLSRLGDPRVRQDDGIRSLFNENSGFEDSVEIDEHVLRLELSVAKATEYFMLTYDPELLSPKGLQTFERNLHDELKTLANDKGVVACSTGLKQITCTRATS